MLRGDSRTTWRDTRGLDDWRLVGMDQTELLDAKKGLGKKDDPWFGISDLSTAPSATKITSGYRRYYYSIAS